MGRPGRRRRVGLALGSGGARGLAHIGVLRGLAEAEIAVDCIAGTSTGALVGAMYAAGQLENFERHVRELDWRDIQAMIAAAPARSRLRTVSRLIERLTGLLGEWHIEDLALPFAAVAVDLSTGEEVLIREGRVIDAIRASTSIPGILVPRRVGDQLLVDAAIRNPVPVSALAELGAQVRVAVNLHAEPVQEIVALPSSPRRARPNLAARFTQALDARRGRFPRSGGAETFAGGDGDGAAPGPTEILTASMSVLEYELTRYRLARDPADVTIEPDVCGIRAVELQKAKLAIREGQRAALAQAREIRRLSRRGVGALRRQARRARARG